MAIEGSPLMTQLTDRVLDLALAQLADWKNAGQTLRMSINLSAVDLSDQALCSRLQVALTRHGVQAHELTVEVTETGILEDPECAQHVLRAIADLGVAMAVDDFGTGYASISRLHQLPIDEVKVDRSFATLTDQRTRSYLSAIVRFGKSLGLRVVAEGVQDAATLDFLVARPRAGIPHLATHQRRRDRPLAAQQHAAPNGTSATSHTTPPHPVLTGHPIRPRRSRCRESWRLGWRRSGARAPARRAASRRRVARCAGARGARRRWCCVCSGASRSICSPASPGSRPDGSPPGAMSFWRRGAGLKARSAAVEDRALSEAQRKIGELSMDNDILRALLEEKGRPRSPRR